MLGEATSQRLAVFSSRLIGRQATPSPESVLSCNGRGRCRWPWGFSPGSDAMRDAGMRPPLTRAVERDLPSRAASSSAGPGIPCSGLSARDRPWQPGPVTCQARGSRKVGGSLLGGLTTCGCGGLSARTRGPADGNTSPIIQAMDSFWRLLAWMGGNLLL